MISLAGKSIQGKRDTNQDSIYFDCLNNCFVLAVADGMGGVSGGEIASQIVVDTVKRLFTRFSNNPSCGKLSAYIRTIVKLAQRHLKITARDNPTISELGSTLVIVLGYNNQYVIGNIGDSRAYKFSGDGAIQVTSDNSLVQDYLHRHNQSEPMISLDNYNHILTRSISANDDPVDIYDNSGSLFTLMMGDIILLCSDGLILDKMNDLSFDIGRFLNTSPSVEIAMERLLEWALEAGSQDNISLVIGYSGKWIARKEIGRVQMSHWRRIAIMGITILILGIIASLCLFLPNRTFNTNKSAMSDTIEVDPFISFNEWSMGEIESTIHLSNRIHWSFTIENDSIIYYQFFLRNVSSSKVDSIHISCDKSNFTLNNADFIETKKEYELWISAYTATGLIATSDKVIRKIEG